MKPRGKGTAWPLGILAAGLLIFVFIERKHLLLAYRIHQMRKDPQELGRYLSRRADEVPWDAVEEFLNSPIRGNGRYWTMDHDPGWQAHREIDAGVTRKNETWFEFSRGEETWKAVWTLPAKRNPPVDAHGSKIRFLLQETSGGNQTCEIRGIWDENGVVWIDPRFKGDPG